MGEARSSRFLSLCNALENSNRYDGHPIRQTCCSPAFAVVGEHIEKATYFEYHSLVGVRSRPPESVGKRVSGVGTVVGRYGWADMAQFVGRLTALKVSRTRTPGRYAGGAGLYLQVSGDGDKHVAKSWTYRFKLRGRAREMGLGSPSTRRRGAPPSRPMRSRSPAPFDCPRLGKQAPPARAASSLVRALRGAHGSPPVRYWDNHIKRRKGGVTFARRSGALLRAG